MSFPYRKNHDWHLTVPGDKSITHRMLMLAAMASGRSAIDGALASLDTRSTARVLRALGAEISPLRKNAKIVVNGSRNWATPAVTLNCGNSGTTARLLLGLIAGQKIAARLTGDASLRRRPMARITEPLGLMGAQFTQQGAKLPISIIGRQLRPLTWDMPVASAQIKSALLFAGVAGEVDVRLSQPGASRDHTERLLRQMGYQIETTESSIDFQPSGTLRGFELVVPGDPSSAAFLLAAGALGQGGKELGVVDVGLNPTRTAFLGVMQRMGVAVQVHASNREGPEPVGSIEVKPAELVSVEVAASEVPYLIDEIPILACLASRAVGVSRFSGLAELRVKESDRLALLAANLRAVGVETAVEGDDLLVSGTDKPLTGRIKTGGDHRIAMAFSVLDPAIEVDNPEAADVSFPGFGSVLGELRGRR